MKQTSKKLLLWLYPISDQVKRRVPYYQVDWLLPEISVEGRLSLIRHLEGERLIFSDKIEDDLSLTLSTHGQVQLEADFPILERARDPWRGDWLLIIFMKAPNTDKNFRYLRYCMLDERCFPLKSGVYLHPGRMSEKLLELLHINYKENVLVIECANWQFGDDGMLIGQSARIKDMLSIYSGISNEINDLLIKKSRINNLSNGQKAIIASIFDRLVLVLEQDNGIIPYYFPQKKTGLDLLISLKLEVEQQRQTAE